MIEYLGSNNEAVDKIIKLLNKDWLLWNLKL
jgi:hypothetical protein